MKGYVTKIDPLKSSFNKHQSYIRVYLQLENGEWAATDVVPTFNNYRRWKPLLKQGNILTGLEFVKGSFNKINADSPVKLVGIQKDSPFNKYRERVDPANQLNLI